MANLTKQLRKELGTNGSLLDLGCGTNSPLQYCVSKDMHSIGVDASENAIEESRKKRIHSDYRQGDILSIGKIFEPKSFDYVIALDLIEHFTKKEGLDLIELMSSIARKKIIIYTPNGFVPQSALNGNPFQVHKSGWGIKEFEEMGFKVSGMMGLKYFRAEEAKFRFKPQKFWSFIAGISHIITKRVPSLAFGLFCVKNVIY